MFKKRRTLGLIFVLGLAILGCECVWADVLDSAVVNFDMETAADLNGPPYTPSMPLNRVDVSGEPISSLNFNGWAHSGNTYYMWQTASGSNNEYVIHTAVTMFTRFRVGSYSSGLTNIVGVFDGNCDPELDGYLFKLNNGVPFFSLVGHLFGEFHNKCKIYGNLRQHVREHGWWRDSVVGGIDLYRVKHLGIARKEVPWLHPPGINRTNPVLETIA